MGMNEKFARAAAKLKRYGRRFMQAIVRPQQQAQASQGQAQPSQAAAASMPELPTAAFGYSSAFARKVGSQPNLLRQAGPSSDRPRLPTPDLASISDAHFAQNSAASVRSSTSSESRLSYASSLQFAQPAAGPAQQSTAAPRPGSPTESVLSYVSSLHTAQPAAGTVTQPVAPPQPPSAPLQTPAPQAQRPSDISRHIIPPPELRAELERLEEPARQAPPTQGLTPAPRTLPRATSTPQMPRPVRPSGPRAPARSATAPTSPQPQLTNRSDDKRNTFGPGQPPGRKSPSL